MSSFHEGGWNGGVPLYTEVSSFQGVGIEGFHCIQRCPRFRGLEWRGSTVYRGVRGWNRGVPLYTEVSGVGIEGFHTQLVYTKRGLLQNYAGC